jgi:hypothetical protein
VRRNDREIVRWRPKPIAWIASVSVTTSGIWRSAEWRAT